MNTLQCTCGKLLRGETGVELYAAVEAHLVDHGARPLEPRDDGSRQAPETEQVRQTIATEAEVET